MAEREKIKGIINVQFTFYNYLNYFLAFCHVSLINTISEAEQFFKMLLIDINAKTRG